EEQASEQAAVFLALTWRLAGKHHQRRRGYYQRQDRREGEAEDNRRGERDPPLCRRRVDRRLMVEELEAKAHRDRQDAEDRRRRRQHDGACTLAAGLQHRVHLAPALVAQTV